MSRAVIKTDDAGLVTRHVNNSGIEGSLGEETFLVGKIIWDPPRCLVEQRVEKLVTLDRALERAKNQGWSGGVSMVRFL
jgi:hypothetical protein